MFFTSRLKVKFCSSRNPNLANMKNALTLVYQLALVVILFSCNKDDVKPDEINIEHVGEKWLITSVVYNIVDQNLTNPGQAVKIGTLANAGAFYFDGVKGSFDITIDDYHKEDVFSFQENSQDVTIISISQNVGVSSFSQHVIAISGEKISATTMSLQGTVTKQSTKGQFVLTGTFSLTKE